MHSFRLVTSVITVGVTEPTVISPNIREPIQFSDVKLQGDSDPLLHGFLYNYSEEDIKLIFTCESALSLISEQYYAYGSDVDIRFQIIYTDVNGDETIDYDGVIQGDSIIIEPGRVKATIAQKSIHQVVDSRMDSPISMDATTTLDGKSVTSPLWKDLRLPGQALRQSEESNRVKREDFSAEIDGVPAMLFFITPNTDEVPAEINQEKPKIESIAALKRSMGGIVAGINPENVGDGTSLPFLKADAAGTFALQFDWIFTVEASLTRRSLDIGAPHFKTWTIRPLMVIVTPDGQRTETEIAPRQGGGGEKTFLDRKTVEIHVNQTLTLEKDTKVFLYVHLYIAADKPIKRMTVNVTALQVHIKLSTLTRAEPSLARVWLLSDAIRHVLRCITNQSDLDTSPVDPLLSGLLSSGPAADYMVTNGASLRGVPKAPTFTLKQLMGVLYAYHNAGMQYKGTRIQIEEGLYFYQDSEILQLEATYQQSEGGGYREEVATDHLFNQIEIGYEKYPTEGAGVREEFNTTRTYQTPLVNFGQKLEINCPLIGAGTLIEQVRTVQFSEEPTASHANDDDGFILHGQPGTYSNLVRFQTTDPEPFPGITYSRRIATFFLNSTVVRAGAELEILSGVAAGSILKITHIISRGLTGVRAEFQPVGNVPNTTGLEPVTFRSLTEPLKIRNDERLLITGLSDPATVVNAELSPARMLRQHAPFLLNGLRYKPLASELRCTFFAQNGDMTSTVRPTSAPLPGDPFKQTVYESGPVALGELEKVDGKLFSPEWIYATVIIEREDMKLLLAALSDSGDAPIGKRRGYLTVRNPDGTLTSGWIRQGGYIRYNPCSEVAEIKMIKRYDLTTVVDCDQYRNWTFEQFETDPTADPNVYLFCRFLDFN